MHIEHIFSHEATSLDLRADRLARVGTYDIVLRTQDSFQLVGISLLRVDIKLANDDILELPGWPPAILHMFQEGLGSEPDFFRHLVNAGQARHSNRHFQELRVSEHELIASRCAFTKHIG